MTDLAFVFGTRPEIIKVMPVVEKLQTMGQIPLCIFTGQHQELVVGTPLKVASNVLSLGLKSDGNVTRWLSRAFHKVQNALCKTLPRMVVVQGDAMSAYVGARAAHLLGIPIAHIEAGVRSHDMSEPWPEEGLRREIDALATWRYAATETAQNNLLKEGIELGTIMLTGNTCVSALARYTNVQPISVPDKRVLITLHRRELTQDLAKFRPVVDALVNALRAFPDIEFVWPVHPSVAGVVFSDKPKNLQFILPLPYVVFTQMLTHVQGVLTDSGGVVEEATTLGVPTAVLRQATDRPEAESVGVARRFVPTPEGVRAAVEALAEPWKRIPSNIYGLPDTATHVAKHLLAVALAPSTT